jgi:hypothetical protein
VRPGELERSAGYALLALLALLVAGALGIFVSQLGANAGERRRNETTANALAEAKRALIAWSVTQGDLASGNSRPGNLPCPDHNDDGSDDGSCSAATGSTLGRLPWKTLDLADLRDGAGERLWYVVDSSFRKANMNAAAINSDSAGSLTVFAGDGKTSMAGPGGTMVAVVLAPGAPTAGQDRGLDRAMAANFLEAALGANNASAKGPFIDGPVQDTRGNTILNDRALGITSEELIRAIEVRALSEAEQALVAYAAVNAGRYPNAARHDAADCLAPIVKINLHASCPADAQVCVGRLPEDVLDVYAATWFNQNGWGRVLTYAVAKNKAKNADAAACPAQVSLSGMARSYVLIAPGARRPAQTRPSTLLPSYLEDAANQSAWSTAVGAPTGFVTPSAQSNDQLRSAP